MTMPAATEAARDVLMASKPENIDLAKLINREAEPHI
jgi:hypothetical protein